MRAITLALLGVLAGSAVAVGVAVPPEAAQALAAPPPLPVSLSSELSALIGDGALTGTEAAAAAGSSGVALAASPAAAGVAVGAAGAGAFVGTAGAVGLIIRAAGGSTEGLCSAGSFLGSLYGQDCSSATVAPVAGASPNADQLPVWDVDLCDLQGSCWHFGSPHPITKDINGGNVSDLYGYDVTPVAPNTQSLADLGSSQSAYYVKVYRLINGRKDVSYQLSGGVSKQGGYYVLSTPEQFGLGGFDAKAGYCVTLAGPDGCSTTGAPTAPYGADISGKPGADPDRYFRTDVTLDDGSSATCKTRTFKESDSKYPAACEPKVAEERIPTHMKVAEYLTDGSIVRVIEDFDTSPAYRKAAESYPDCARAACELRVFVDGKACTVGGTAACQDWPETAEDDPSRVECRYGTHVVDLDECNVLKPYYKPEHQEKCEAYGDPRTGEPASGSGGTGCAPEESTPSTGTGTGIEPGGKDCLGDSITANPLTWVTGPVVCAMKAAFEPDPAVLQEQTASLRNAWSDTAPVQVAQGAAGFFQGLPTNSGCSGIHFTWPAILGAKAVPLNILNACEPPISTAAAFARLILDVSVTVSAVLAISRYAGGTIAFGGLGKSGGDQ